jgi:hypothetical protein
MIPDDPAGKKLFRQQDAAKAMSEHAKEQKRLGDNRERLKAERLAREATALANTDASSIKPKKTAARKRSTAAGKDMSTK